MGSCSALLLRLAIEVAHHRGDRCVTDKERRDRRGNPLRGHPLGPRIHKRSAFFRCVSVESDGQPLRGAGRGRARQQIGGATGIAVLIAVLTLFSDPHNAGSTPDDLLTGMRATFIAAAAGPGPVPATG